MAKKIDLGDISNLYESQVKDLVKRVTFATKSQLQNRKPQNLGTPKDTEILADGWMVDVSEPLRGVVFNSVEYAEPVIYGTNLPPSWQGRWRTRLQAVQGFPDLLAEKVITRKFVPKLMREIVRGR